MKCIDIMVEINTVYDEVYTFNRPINIEISDDSRCIKVSLQHEVDMRQAISNVVRLIQNAIDGIEVKNEYGEIVSIDTTKWQNELYMETSCARFHINKLSDYQVQLGIKAYVPVVKES